MSATPAEAGGRRRAPRRAGRLAARASLLLLVGLAALYLWLAWSEGEPVASHPFFAAEGARTQVIAHRGGSGLRPENTLAAFEHALALGSDIIELDVRATADGELVVMHDATVARTTDGAGAVSALTLAEIKRLDAGYRFTADGGRSFPFRGRGVAVPTLEEVLTSFPEARMVIEPKDEAGGAAAKLCEALRGRGAGGRVIVGSFRESNLEEFRRACPEVATSASTTEALRFLAAQKAGVAESLSPRVQALQVPVYFGGMRVLTRDFVERARGLNLKVHAWTVNDPEEMRRLVEAGVDGIMTDYPDRLLELTERRPQDRPQDQPQNQPQDRPQD
ncbi:MAG TPA: glycerophosphodiester phosphodiesterase [Pyrinomonadaceae bacterium]|nr:glycerophosphodiester phosphodiesterase [Pyrinomonadaceae bacterium]